MDEIEKNYKEALLKKYEADIQIAKANFLLYIKKSVGVGEHSDIIDELDKALTLYTDSKGKLDSLKEIDNQNNLQKING